MNRLSIKLFPIACILTCLPVWLAEYPPLVDLPQHAAQIALIKSHLSGTLPFPELFQVNLFSPYWAGYGISLAFSYFTDITTAVKITLSIALVFFPYSCYKLRQSTNAPHELDWLFIPVTYGFAYQWGFLNFLIALPLGVFLLYQIVKNDNPKPRWSLSLWIVVLFLAHILACAFFCILAALLMFDRKQGFTTWVRRALPLTISLPLGITWLVLASDSEQVSTPGPWGLGAQRLLDLPAELLSVPTTIPFVILGAVVAILPFLGGYKLSKSPARFLPFIAYLVLMLIGPNYLFGNFFTYQRFNVLGLILYVICFESSTDRTQTQTKSYIVLVSVFISLTLTTLVNLKSLAFNKETKSYKSITREIKSEFRVLSLPIEAYSPLFTPPAYLHFPSWLQAENRNIVDFSFSNFYPQIIKYKKNMRPNADGNFVWQPHTFKASNHKTENYRYLLIRTHYDIQPWIQVIAPEAKIVQVERPWHLLELPKQQ